ncbi:MAG: MFS transporter [Acidimicrobiales bacterium]
MGPSAYRFLLRAPSVRWLLITSLVARLPSGMVGLAVILQVTRHGGSFSRAGAVVATYVVGAAVAGPILGRLADRLGRRPVLAASATLKAFGLLLLSVVPVGDVSGLLLVAAGCGTCTPPVGAAVRSLWPEVVPEGVGDAIYGADATLQELVFIAGPAIVALIGSLASSAAALQASGLAGLVGTVGLVAHPALAGRARPGARETERARLRPGSIGPLVLVTFLLMTGMGAVEVGVVGFAAASHASGQSGPLLALWSLGSMAGGLLVGARASSGGSRALGWAIAGIGAGFALLAGAPGVSSFYVLLVLSGSAIAPGLACLLGVVGSVAPEGAGTEAFSWIASGTQSGAALGAALGGLVVQGLGARLAFLVAALCALAGAAVAAQRQAAFTGVAQL